MASRDELRNDPEEALRLAFDGRQAVMWTAIPGIVTEVNLEDMTVSVQPAIQGAVSDENGAVTFVDLPVLVKVPVCFPKAGGFVLTMPIAVNDEVLVVFSARAIDTWWQSGGVGKPIEARMHDLSDGFAIPGPASVPNAVANISANSAQLRNEAGTTYIEITSDGKIKFVSPSEIELNGPVKITGDLTQTGNQNITGNVVATAVTSGGIGLATHKHGGVTTGSGTSGTPVP